MTLTFASRLPTTNEYVVASWGQSNNNPKGLRSEASGEATQLLQTNGVDVLVSSVSGSTVTMETSYPDGILVGMELRFILPFYGQSVCPAHAGKGAVIANSGFTLTVTFDVAANILPPAGGLANVFSVADVITLASTALLKAGDRVRFNTGTVPPQLALGTIYWIVGVPTATTATIATTYGGAPLAFATAGATVEVDPLIGGYLYWPDGRGLSYSNIRVLTPYLPEAPGVYPSTTLATLNRAFPAGTAYSDRAAFLDFTFNEGVDGYGAASTAATFTANSLTSAALVGLETDILKGALLQLCDTDIPQIMTVLSNNSGTGQVIFTANWAVQPAGTYAFEVSVPHYRDNPHGRTIGFGFRYPSNHSQPGFKGTGYTYNRPRNRLTPSYVPVSGTGSSAVPVYYMGQMFELGWRMAARLGRRVNIVHLAADASSLERSTLRGGSAGGYTGTPAVTAAGALIGWWTFSTYLDWIPEIGDNLAARFKRLLVTMTPLALTAAGETKPAKFLGEVAFQGESETLTSGRFIYQQLLASVHGWIRTTIHGAGLSYYPNAQDLPVVHAGLSSTWVAVDVTSGSYVQTAIDDWTAIEPAAETFDPSAEPVQVSDPAHYTGLGELHCGNLAGEALASLIDEYVAQAVDDNALEVANMALSLVGETTRVFSIDTRLDQSAQAAECAKFIGVAINELLEGYAWSFATVTKALIAVTIDAVRADWIYAYALPSNLAVPLAVLQPGQTTLDDSVPTELAPYWRAPQANSNSTTLGYKYAIERNANGQLVLYTNIADAVLRYAVRVSAAQQWPMKFKVAVAHKLAAFLAGPFVKGEAGIALAAKLGALADMKAGGAAANDANRNENKPPSQDMPWAR